MSQNPNRHGRNHPSGCYVVEQVVGGTIFTSWDKEEARQVANALLLSGKNTENSLAIRRVACSKLPPPIDERGKPLSPPQSDSHKSSNIGASAIKCKESELATLGYCIEKFDPPEHVDPSSATRKKHGDHYVVLVAKQGSWDLLHERYLNVPFVFEIWHPVNETICKLEGVGPRRGAALKPILPSRPRLTGIRAN